jgi:1-acyl-sn-glycerol-3-phosphate acyltransferase
MISLGHIPVRRGVAEREPLRVALDTLAAGGLVGVFPEGTRTSGAVEQVERGVGYLALRAGCPVVPVACVGTERLLPRGSRLPRLRQPVAVSFGPSVDLGAPAGRASRSAIGEATEQIRAELAALVLRTRTTHATVAPGRTGPPVAANRKESR